MNNSLQIAAQTVFQYPTSPHARRHGPRGYTDYTSYKSWLRDEFIFRCCYCLTRERWRSDGQAGFSVDHFAAQSLYPALRNDYDNLFYVCCACNAARSFISLPFNPSDTSLGAHLRVTISGKAEPLTPEGAQFIDISHLNRPLLIDFRQRLLRLLTLLASAPTPEAHAMLKELLAIPDDLPDLMTKRPPEGNDRAEGLYDSYFQMRQRGELPEFY